MDPHSGDDLIVNLFAAVQSALGKESVQQCSSSALAAAVTTDPPYLYQAVTSTISKHIEKTSPATGAPDDDGAAMRIDVRGGGKAVPEAGRSLTSAFDLGLCEADQASLQAVLAKGQAAGERGGGQLEGDERATQRVVEENANKALQSLRERRRRAALARETALSRMASRSAAFAHSAKCRLAQARAQGLVKSRRLLLQGADATRRLQELLHECIGEYEKARLREARIRKLSAEACDSVLHGKILDLRWSRFCSRLEDDALGLVKAYDMGNPAAPAQSSSSHGRRASVASSLAANAAAAQSVGVLLGPLLARCGLSDSRILRVVSLCPCSGSVPDDGDDIASSSGSGGADNDLRLTGLEHRANLGKGLFGRGRRGRRRQACTGGVEQALLRNGGASAVSLVAENSRLGVADAFRQAVLCGNPALVTALSRSDDAAPVLRRRSGGGSASTGILARPRGATGSRRSTALDIGHSQRERSGGNVSSRIGPDTAKSGVGHNRVEAEGSADRVPRGGWRRENATDADGRKEAAAMVFARSVSGMLAEAYLGGAKARPGEEKVGLCAERTEKDAKEVAAAGPGGGGAWKGHAWGSLADAPPAGAKAVPSLVVSEIADAHRRRPRLNSNNDAGEDRRLSEALDAIPDVLVAEVGAAGPKRAAKWKQAAESSPTGSRSGSVVSSDARESHGRRRQPAQESGNWRGGARAPATPANAPLHFAPAGVLHLLGTTECREFVEALPPATRARVLALHEGFPDETPPVGRLYVPLASPTSRESLSMTWGGATARGRRRAARGLWEADDNSGKEQVSTHREEGGQTRPMPVAVEIGANEAVSDRPRYASNTASGATPALLGALVHTLPTQAVRELLQVYLVTTRAVGAVSVGGVAAGEGARVRRRTSGLLMLPPPLPPPPPPHFLARDCATPASRIDGVDNDKKDGNVNGNRRKSNSGPSRWRAVPDGGASVERRPEDLSEKGGGGDGMEEGRGWLCVAAMPPSAVDVLPDAPSSGDRAVDGPPVPPIGRTEGSAVGLPGKEKERQTSFRYDCPDDFIGGADAGNALKIEDSVGGRKPQTSAGMTIEGGREMSSRSRTTGDMAIFSSLQAPYHHAYVAVLAPPSPAVDNSTGDGNVTDVGSGNITSNGNGNSNINGHITGNGNSTGNGARVVAASNIIDPISSASALILQVDRSVPESPRCDASENDVYGDGEAPATTSGSGGYDEVVVMGKRGKEGAREVPPRVCGWRACLADAAAGSLCLTHEQVRHFLDGKAAKAGCVSDSFRFLPPGSGPKRRSSVRKRRATAGTSTSSWPSSSAATAGASVNSTAGSGSGGGGGGEEELVALRSMSPLLSELLNGKLGTTIAMFCQRAAVEAKTWRLGERRASDRAGDELNGGGKVHRAVERHGSGRAPIKKPDWARWANQEEAEAADRKVAADIHWAEQVCVHTVPKAGILTRFAG
eukprot:jgi/Undpi1/4909/HiC_scaffold_19.g08261.m1